jgi:hypothetical protein
MEYSGSAHAAGIGEDTYCACGQLLAECRSPNVSDEAKQQ